MERKTFAGSGNHKKSFEILEDILVVNRKTRCMEKGRSNQDERNNYIQETGLGEPGYNLNLGKNQSKIWPFTLSMTGSSISSADGTAIVYNGERYSAPQEKTPLFLDLFATLSPSNIHQNPDFQTTTNLSIESSDPHILN